MSEAAGVLIGLGFVGFLYAYLSQQVEMEVWDDSQEDVEYKHTFLKWLFMFMSLLMGALVPVFTMGTIANPNTGLTEVADYMMVEVMQANLAVFVFVLGYFLLLIIVGLLGKWTNPSYGQR